MTHRATNLFLLLLFTSQLAAQYQIGLVPRVSPDRAVYQKIGYTEVEVRYGSPAVRGRDIWGELVPYDNLWRAGANSATTVELSQPVRVKGMPLDSGQYALFVLPRENDVWTVLFNSNAQQWGAFRHDPAKDVLRVDLIPRRTNLHQEHLTYHLRQVGYRYGSIVLQWEHYELEIPFQTDYLDLFEREVETRAAAQPEYLRWIVLLQGAEHLQEMGTKQEVARSWLDRAERLEATHSEWNEQFYPREYVLGHLYWTKAKVLAETGDLAEATNYGTKMKQLSNPIFYERKQEAEQIEALLKLWQQ